MNSSIRERGIDVSIFVSSRFTEVTSWREKIGRVEHATNVSATVLNVIILVNSERILFSWVKASEWYENISSGSLFIEFNCAYNIFRYNVSCSDCLCFRRFIDIRIERAEGIANLRYRRCIRPSAIAIVLIFSRRPTATTSLFSLGWDLGAWYHCGKRCQ